MSERPTPETDCESGFFDMETGVSAAFARRLERERDEAMRQLDNIKASSIHSCHDQCQKPMCVLRRERDKWEETARLYCQNSDFHREMREKAERERDDAREKLENLKLQLALWEDGNLISEETLGEIRLLETELEQLRKETK